MIPSEEGPSRWERWRPRSLRSRLALWFGAVLAIALVAYSASVYLMVVLEEQHEGERGDGEEAENAGQIVLAALGVGLPVALVVAISGGLWLSRRGLRPIDEVVRIASGLDAGRLNERLPIRPGDADEVMRLSSALNGMLDRIKRSVEATRRFTADASHELRTPLAILRGELEIALRRPRSEPELRATLESGLEELGKLSRLVDSLLVLARSDAGELPLQRQRVEVDRVVREVIEPYQAIAAERKVRLTANLEPGLVVDADPLWMGRAIANLVDNACKFTPSGGEIRVELQTESDRVRISVFDSGPSLSPSDQARVFERFYRADAARGSATGSGLGLPLAREIARALGGDLGLSRSLSTGNQFWLEVPGAGRRS
jgi:heavy metal sensor kinase